MWYNTMNTRCMPASMTPNQQMCQVPLQREPQPDGMPDCLHSLQRSVQNNKQSFDKQSCLQTGQQQQHRPLRSVFLDGRHGRQLIGGVDHQLDDQQEQLLSGQCVGQYSDHHDQQKGDAGKVTELTGIVVNSTLVGARQTVVMCRLRIRAARWTMALLFLALAPFRLRPMTKTICAMALLTVVKCLLRARLALLTMALQLLTLASLSLIAICSGNLGKTGGRLLTSCAAECRRLQGRSAPPRM